MVDEKQEQLSEMVQSFCDEYLNDEYKHESQKIIEKMANRKSVLFKRGRLEVWASAVIYAVCQINSLFDKSNEFHINRKDILNYFNTKQSTVSLKANNLRDIFNLDHKSSLNDFESFENIYENSDEERYINFMDNIFGEDNPIYNDNMTVEDYQRTINSYKRKLGESFFKQHEGEFWLIRETRPFMQSLFEQAQLFWENGEKEKAINQYKYMLRLNPNDNQGVRDSLLPNLLELNRLDEAQELYLQYENDFTANWKFGKLLLDIKNNVSFDKIKVQYNACNEYNPYVVPYLLGNKKLPKEMPYFYGIGDENEAVFYVSLSSNAWKSDENAMKILKKLNEK